MMPRRVPAHLRGMGTRVIERSFEVKKKSRIVSTTLMRKRISIGRFL